MTTLKDRKKKEALAKLKKYDQLLIKCIKGPNSNDKQKKIIEYKQIIEKQKRILKNLDSYK